MDRLGIRGRSNRDESNGINLEFGETGLRCVLRYMLVCVRAVGTRMSPTERLCVSRSLET